MEHGLSVLGAMAPEWPWGHGSWPKRRLVRAELGRSATSVVAGLTLPGGEARPLGTQPVGHWAESAPLRPGHWAESARHTCRRFSALMAMQVEVTFTLAPKEPAGDAPETYEEKLQKKEREQAARAKERQNARGSVVADLEDIALWPNSDC